MASSKERLWKAEYFKCFNATEAARRVGYKWPNKVGPQKLKKFADEIEAYLKENLMSADEVLFRLADQARGSMEDFINIETLITEEGGFVDDYSVSLEKAARLGKLHLIKKISVGPEKVTIELHDSQAALKLIGQHHKLFSMRHSLDVEKNSKLEEWLNALTGAKNDEPMAEPGAEVGDVSPDGARSEPAPGETSP